MQGHLMDFPISFMIFKTHFLNGHLGMCRFEKNNYQLYRKI
jgi:hypothetical protein